MTAPDWHQQRVLSVLADGRWWARPDLGRATSMGRASVVRTVQALQARGLVEVQHGDSGNPCMVRRIS